LVSAGTTYCLGTLITVVAHCGEFPKNLQECRAF
jgi:hypothetical protein